MKTPLLRTFGTGTGALSVGIGLMGSVCAVTFFSVVTLTILVLQANSQESRIVADPAMPVISSEEETDKEQPIHVLSEKAERPLDTTEDTLLSVPSLRNFHLYYATIEPNVKLQFKTLISHEYMTEDSIAKERDEFVSSTGDNYYYLFDPLYSTATKKIVFKYGRADGALDAYRLMSYDPDGKGVSLLNARWLRNRNIQLSPNGEYIAYIVGGGYEGPDHAYYKKPIELWILDIRSRTTWMIARGDSLHNSYDWKSPHVLVYSNVIKDKGLELYEYSTLDKQQTQLFAVPTAEWGRSHFASELVRKSSLVGRKLQNQNILLTKNLPFDYKNFQVSSSFLDDKRQVLYFAVYATSKQDIDDANAGRDKIVNHTYDIWRYDLRKSVFERKGRANVQSFIYLPTVKVVGEVNGKCLLLAQTFIDQRSPITKGAEIGLPTKKSSLLMVDENLTTTLWMGAATAGVSLLREGDQVQLLPY